MKHYLHAHGVLTKIRDSAGQDIDGGCGQLRARAADHRHQPSAPTSWRHGLTDFIGTNLSFLLEWLFAGQYPVRPIRTARKNQRAASL
jgi:hypothetical protein